MTVIHLPVTIVTNREDDFPKTCDRCVHFMSGYLGQFCRSYSEDIFSVHEAESCDFFEAV